MTYSKADMVELLKEDYPILQGATLKNPVDALANTFTNSPLGTTSSDEDSSLKVGLLTMQGNKVKTIRKYGTSKISSTAVAYMLYKNAETNNMYELTVSDIYERGCMGVYNVFNMDSENFLKALRSLTTKEILSADLLGGLENIHLINEFTSKMVLERLVKRI